MSASDNGFSAYLQCSIAVLDALAATHDPAVLARASAAIVSALAADLPLLVCGNGGSAADAMHISGELVGRFLADRRALNVICLSANAAVLTAWANDTGFDDVFARQVEAHGRAGGVLLAISTSGKSENVVRACAAARAKGMAVIALTGEGGGRLAPLADMLLAVPARETPLIQQAHLCIYHHLCAEVERALSG
jgi:D-sedoheptulose 7-phosphate isomerase